MTEINEKTAIILKLEKKIEALTAEAETLQTRNRALEHKA
jgi:cell division protein FtsB